MSPRGSQCQDGRTDCQLQRNSAQMSRYVVPCSHGMTRPRVMDEGDGFQIWKVAASITNNRPRTADKAWSSSLGVERGANNCSP
jgi:hypothetical protein